MPQCPRTAFDFQIIIYFTPDFTVSPTNGNQSAGLFATQSDRGHIRSSYYIDNINLYTSLPGEMCDVENGIQMGDVERHLRCNVSPGLGSGVSV